MIKMCDKNPRINRACIGENILTLQNPTCDMRFVQGCFEKCLQVGFSFDFFVLRFSFCILLYIV